MNEPTIFTRIITGEIPSHKIYEDALTLAFLDIHPARAGHTLVVPKVEVSRMEDLADKDYSALMATVKKVMQRQVEVFGRDFRVCLKVIGFDVPHVHVQVIPCKTPADFLALGDPTKSDHEALAAMAQKLAFH